MVENITKIKERILQIADLKKVSKEFFLESINQSYSNYKGKSKNSNPSTDVLVEISSKYPDININWLLTGEGEMIKNDFNTNISIVSEPLTITRRTRDKKYSNQEIPLYDFEASAGLKGLFNTDTPRKILDTIRIPNLPKCDGAISVTGDSMYPLLKSGDIILYRETDIQSIFYGEMYLISVQLNEWEEYITVKYVQRSEIGEDYVKLVSQNHHHQPKDIPINNITALALIKASIRINTMM
ncbi:LexA family transcriptional regulator [Chishuiella changwenlii]|uniref:LexA family transcriptional regulator n=1 Tax=Chishuiella changwenlii TaxID=1434701 RepID=UPI002FDA25F0